MKQWNEALRTHLTEQHLELECTAAEGEGIGPFAAAPSPGLQELHGAVVPREPANRWNRNSAEAPSTGCLMLLQLI